MENKQVSENHDNSGKKTISFQIPKIKITSVQSVILVLLIFVGTLQTAQLFGLNNKLSNTNIKQAAAASSPANTSTSTTTALPEMVGGC